VTPDAIERLAQTLARSAASRLAEGSGSAVTADLISAAPLGPATWATRTFPVVAVMLPCSGAALAESVVVLAPEAARALVAALTPDAPLDSDELDERALSTIAHAVDALYAGATAALQDQHELELTFAPASARMLEEAGDLATGADDWALSYSLLGETLALEIIQTIPAALAAALAPPPEAVPVADEPIADSNDDPIASTGGGPVDVTQLAVERASAIAAEATAEVLSALFSEELSAATPVVEAASGDLLASLEYPLIVAEVSYVLGIVGSNRFVLRPADAAQLAAAMMGTPEATGDGLSAIEQSAVSEAMNQVMSATARELSKALGTQVEVAPPTCVVVDTAEQAQASIGDSAYRASFGLISTVFGAEIVQFVSAELALSLTDAFTASALAEDAPDSLDGAFGAFADLPFAGFEGVSPEPADPRAGARELLSGIRVRVSAELGRSRLPIARVANMPAGSIVVLDRAPSDPVDVLVNGTPFAQAKVVLVDGEYAVQILSLTPLELNG
jgi:flagellar motor switch protein FliN/FliY